MELLLVCDLEGISGIGEWAWCQPDHPLYSQALTFYRQEIQAVAVAARQRGIRRVTFLDWHQRNLPPDFLPDGVELATLPLTQVPRLAVLLGFHTRTNHATGFASHTLLPDLRVSYNGREIGELFLASRWLGEQGIPLALVTGDRALTLEAEQTVDQTATVAVKVAQDTHRAECIPTERAHSALLDALIRVLERPAWWWVYRPTLVSCQVSVPGQELIILTAKTIQDLLTQLVSSLRPFGSLRLPGTPLD